MGQNSSFNAKTKNLLLTKLRKNIDKIKKFKNRLKSKKGGKIHKIGIKINFK